MYNVRASIESIKWETVASTNIGLDVELFDQRIVAALDYFVKETMKNTGCRVRANVVEEVEVDEDGNEIYTYIVTNGNADRKWITNYNPAVSGGLFVLICFCLFFS